ncbi:MAG: 3-hydroxyacyl-CoA dehydrogenase NAD-binding domain-containing protein [Ilumatobacteraceae bacterium]
MSVQRVAVIGTGVIGASWAAKFLAAGLDVVAWDPGADAEARLRSAIDTYWPVLERIGLADGASPERVALVGDPAAAVADADFVQESGPEVEDLKVELFERLDASARDDVVIASSSSGLLPSVIQSECRRRPERVLVGHPFHPAHLVPLVEVVGGQQTSEDAIESALAFYAAIGKRPIRVNAELPGHVTNRMQAALWREAYWLVASGAATVADIDTALSNGPGLRWALLGPFATQHLSGGAGGIAHVLEHLGPPMVEWWHTFETPEWTDELKAAVAAGVDAELAHVDQAAMARERDILLEQLIVAKARASHLPG